MEESPRFTSSLNNDLINGLEHGEFLATEFFHFLGESQTAVLT